MSCDWDVRCLDCEEDHGFDDMNHESDLMLRLAALGPELAAFAPAMAKVEAAARSGARLLVQYDRGAINFAWFAVHGNHRLTAVDEYGRCFDECGEYFSYCECKHQKLCRRTKGHDGQHHEKRDPP